ncbi:hypothetical protein BDY21DRAFT_388547 [Lineolata rhizophorae]|uniref:Protein kinase domain-containing protein n=1 Tax=Lineolata rhizophorae TaxID=578093 RepID=A0A6A6NLD2_9PEZI|nr:hypothetical protein BDY21DRAFT_388547 [Lineolata rhizophorae]
MSRHWDYRILDAIKGDATHTSTVFKAEVVPHENVSNPPKWALIKTASPEDADATENLGCECTSYRLPGVSSAAWFREMYDVIDDMTIAVEWLDTTLAEVKYQPDMRTYALIKTFLKAALTSCVVLDGPRYHPLMNPDYKPANILLSGVKTSSITAKVGDLGLVFPASDRINVQPLAMRAPEVFLGQVCTEPSQVWAIAAMVLSWIKTGVLGKSDSPHPLVNAAWCMAKIKRLFPDWEIPTPEEVERPTLQATVKAARRMSREEEPILAILQKVEMPQQLRDLLRLMLVTNPDKRPSASTVLASAEFRAFEKLVGM